jgi:poly-gamma-glutamate synthesis protein (capsule biosynthesis protein)
VGKNIAEARRPVILERKNTKVGFLAYSCVHAKGYEAEADKPGLVPVRVWTIYEQTDYQPGTPPRIVTIPYKEDLEAMVGDIKKLKAEVDVVVIAIHWGLHLTPRVIPMYCFEVGHAAVDAGADLILGTHPHILKGIEVYKSKTIFYSTCNFAAEIGPAIRKGPGGKFVDKLLTHYGCELDPECPTYLSPREARATLIAKAVVEDGEIKSVSYIPVYVNTNAEPEIVKPGDAKAKIVYEYMEDISRSEGLPVRFSWAGDEVLIQSATK